jgi:hypothetical protein
LSLNSGGWGTLHRNLGGSGEQRPGEVGEQRDESEIKRDTGARTKEGVRKKMGVKSEEAGTEIK